MEIIGMTSGLSRFDQHVISISLVNICNQESYIGREMRKRYNTWKEETDESVNSPWLDLHKFIIYIPHPSQPYEDLTLEEGLSKGYNLEVEPVRQKSQVPYKIPRGGHFVIVLKQKGLDSDFKIAATGIFVRPLAALSLDVIIDPDQSEYKSLIVKHPVIRDYPENWQTKLIAFLKREITNEELPNVIRHVDQALNQDYRPPTWKEIYA